MTVRETALPIFLVCAPSLSWLDRFPPMKPNLKQAPLPARSFLRMNAYVGDLR
jgi:hypothetical protein